MPEPRLPTWPCAALHGPLADLGRVGVAHRAVVLAALQVPLRRRGRARRRTGSRRAAPRPARPGRSRCHTAPRPMPRGMAGSRPSISARDAGAARSRSRSAVSSRTPQEMSKPDPAGRDHPAGLDVGGGDAADREAVPPVHVRHGVGGADDAGQGGHVRHLLQRPVRPGVGQQLAGRRRPPPAPASVAAGRSGTGTATPRPAPCLPGYPPGGRAHLPGSGRVRPSPRCSAGCSTRGWARSTRSEFLTNGSGPTAYLCRLVPAAGAAVRLGPGWRDDRRPGPGGARRPPPPLERGRGAPAVGQRGAVYRHSRHSTGRASADR